MSAQVWEVFADKTSGLPLTVIFEVPDGRRWSVPRIFIALHLPRIVDLPDLAAQYGFEPIPR